MKRAIIFILMIIMMSISVNATNITIDTFHDGSINSTLWDYLLYGTGTLAENSGLLKLDDGASTDSGVAVWMNQSDSVNFRKFTGAFYIYVTTSVRDTAGNGVYMQLVTSGDVSRGTIYNCPSSTTKNDKLVKVTFGTNDTVEYFENGVKGGSFQRLDEDLYLKAFARDSGYSAGQNNYMHLNYTYLNSSDPDNTSLILNFYDEETKTLITGKTLTFIGMGENNNTFNDTTTTGTFTYNIWDDIAPDNYTIYYYGTDYEQREYYLELEQSDYTSLDLYLLNKTKDQLNGFRVLDYNGDYVEDVIVKAKALFISTSQYAVVSECKSAFNGRCYMYQKMNYPYSYTLEKNGVTKEISPFVITTSYTDLIDFIFDTTTPFELEDLIDNIDTNLTYNNATNNLKYWFDVNSGETYNFCMNTYNNTYLSGNTLINTSCLSSSSGTITYNIDITNESIYVVGGFYNGADFVTLDSGYFSGLEIKGLRDVIGSTGLIIALLIIVTLAIIGATQSPASAIIMTILGVICVTMVGLMDIVWGIIAGVIIIGLTIAYLSKT